MCVPCSEHYYALLMKKGARAAAAPLVIRPTVAARLQPFKPLLGWWGKGIFVLCIFKRTALTPITLLFPALPLAIICQPVAQTQITPVK